MHVNLKKREVAMKRFLFATVMMSLILAMSGCGDGGGSTVTRIVTSIPSDPAFDGDILNGITVSPLNAPKACLPA